MIQLCNDASVSQERDAAKQEALDALKEMETVQDEVSQVCICPELLHCVDKACHDDVPCVKCPMGLLSTCASGSAAVFTSTLCAVVEARSGAGSQKSQCCCCT